MEDLNTFLLKKSIEIAAKKVVKFKPGTELTAE